MNHHKKTNIIDTSTTLGQSASSITSKPVLNQSVNVNIMNKEIKDEKADENKNVYNEILNRGEKEAKEKNNELDIYKRLICVYKNVLLNDDNREIILNADDLIDIIALLVGVERNSVKITYYIEEIGCVCKKENPIKEIQSIKIYTNNQYLDLFINFNGVFNKIKFEFNISLSRVYYM